MVGKKPPQKPTNLISRPCELVIGNQRWTKLEISSAYEEKNQKYREGLKKKGLVVPEKELSKVLINDDLIAKVLVPQLDGKSEDEINQEGRSYHWTYYSYEPVLNQNGQAYRLVWCLDDNEPGIVGIMKCYWRDKYNEGEAKFLRKEWKKRYKLNK